MSSYIHTPHPKPIINWKDEQILSWVARRHRHSVSVWVGISNFRGPWYLKKRWLEDNPFLLKMVTFPGEKSFIFPAELLTILWILPLELSIQKVFFYSCGLVANPYKVGTEPIVIHGFINLLNGIINGELGLFHLVVRVVTLFIIGWGAHFVRVHRANFIATMNPASWWKKSGNPAQHARNFQVKEL